MDWFVALMIACSAINGLSGLAHIYLATRKCVGLAGRAAENLSFPARNSPIGLTGDQSR